MENLIISFNAIISVFLIVAVGFTAGRTGVLREEVLPSFNNAAFRFFMPFLLFKNIYTTDVKALFDRKLVFFIVSSLIALCVVLTFLVDRTKWSAARRGAVIHVLCRSNLVLLGLPIATELYGAGGIGPMPIVVAVTIPMFNVLAVCTLEIHRGGNVSPGIILLGILKNPLILGSIAGVLCLMLRVTLPAVIGSAVGSLAAAATPLTLFLLGAAFRFDAVKPNLRALAACTVMRLAVIPSVFVGAGIILGFRGAALTCILMVFGCPTAANAYTMAQQMGSDAEFTGECSILSTFFSCFTLFLWIFLLKEAGLI